MGFKFRAWGCGFSGLGLGSVGLRRIRVRARASGLRGCRSWTRTQVPEKGYCMRGFGRT